LPLLITGKMYNQEQVLAAMTQLVKWTQNHDPSGTQIEAGSDLLTGTTGTSYQMENSLVTIDNILSIAPDFSKQTAVQSEINAKFTQWLLEFTQGSIIKVIDRWLTDKTLDRSARNLLDRDTLYTGGSDTAQTDAAGSQIAGLELATLNSRSIKYKITHIGLQLTQAQTLTLYLFHTSSPAPIDSQELNYTTANAQQWFEIDGGGWELDGAGTYYIAYLQDDLAGQSINGIYDYSYTRYGAMTYPGGEALITTAFTADHSSATLWDVRRNAYSESTNYGLNAKFYANCDYTDLLIEQKHLFATAIRKQVAADTLKALLNNAEARTNRHQTNATPEKIMFQLYGDPRGRDTSLETEILRAVKAISFDERSIDGICLPCQKKGAKWM
jgi:hypothetical protein